MLESSLLAPYGKLVTGHVLDCDKASLERSLKDYDKQLYIKWNPKKNKGYGSWEIRRHPDKKQMVYKCDFNGYKIFEYEYKELDIINHVLDVPYLSREVVGRIKKMDTWTDKRWNQDLEYREATHRDAQDKKARDDLKYNIKQHTQQWRDFMSHISQGGNPGQVLSGVWKATK